jgi:hypothetical protein
MVEERRRGKVDMSRKKWNNGAMWMMSKQINPPIMIH